MENRFKTELGCEVALSTFYGWLLGDFGLELGSQILVYFPKFGILSSLNQTCLHLQSRLRRCF